MLNISGVMIKASMMEILEVLKSDLQDSGIDLLKDIRPTGDNIMITCPVHKGGKESKPSCGVQVETGVVHCFTCGYRASLPEFIGTCFGKDGKEAYFYGKEWLKETFSEISIEDRPDIDLDMNRKQLHHVIHSYVPDMVLQQYRFYHPYMFKRKMTKKVIEQFDIGFDKETNCLTFPVRNAQGDCLFVARRSVSNKWFNYPCGAEKPLYGLYEATKAGMGNELVVCESMINCITCWAHGIQAVALNGTGSKEQLYQLSLLPVRSLVLCLDPDDAGRKGMQRIKNFCTNKLIYTVNYKDNRDINDLEPDEFDELMNTKHFIERY